MLSNVARDQILSDYKNEVLLFLHFFAFYPSSCGGHATEQWYGLEGSEVVLPGDFLCTFFVSYFLRVKAVLICCWLDGVENGREQFSAPNATSPHLENRRAPNHDDGGDGAYTNCFNIVTTVYDRSRFRPHRHDDGTTGHKFPRAPTLGHDTKNH